MALVVRRALAAGCVAFMLAAGVGTVASLRHPDPRARGAWAEGASVLTPTPRDVSLYLPSCDISAVRIHTAPGQTGTVTATITRTVPGVAEGARQLAHGRWVVNPPGFVDVPLTVAPVRERVQLQLSSETSGLTLDASRPFTLVQQRTSALGLLSCVVDEHSGLTWALLALLALHLTGLGWLAATVLTPRQSVSHSDPRSAIRDPRSPIRDSAWNTPRGPLAAVAVVSTTLLLYLISVPAFEPPDELAHLQYARFVAVTTGLPHAVPPADSEWRSSVYEWVQQPAYYMLAAAVLRLTGDAWARPAPEPHPQSRLAGGADVSIYRHPDTTSPAGAHRALVTLRLLSVLMAMVTVWCTARAVTLATGDARLGAASAAALALVHQWAAVMGIVSTDPPATMTAAVATLLMCRLLRARAPLLTAGMTGAVIGLAYATKATSVFLVPMAAVTLLAIALRRSARVAGVSCLWLVFGALLTAAWIPLRAWLVFGDPLARAFKREVLAVGGFVVVEGPPVLSVAFLEQLRLMVFESFWARFGSLGAGPLPGTRLWWVYGAATTALIAACALGALRMAVRTPSDTRVGSDEDGARRWMVTVAAVGVATGVTLWAWVNLVPQADVIVHWTPRHILPLTAPLLILTASGLQGLRSWLPASLAPWLRACTAAAVLVLTVTGLAVLRSVLLGFHFGY